MSNKENSSSHLSQPLLYGAGVLVLIAFTVVLVPAIHQYFRKLIHQPYRQIISTTTGDILKDGKTFQILKIQTQQGLSLEIYGNPENGLRPLVDKIHLPDRQNGYIYFQQQSTPLALHDIDGDETLEILAPTFDDELVAHLNVYKFNRDTHLFELYSSTQGAQ